MRYLSDKSFGGHYKGCPVCRSQVSIHALQLVDTRGQKQSSAGADSGSNSKSTSATNGESSSKQPVLNNDEAAAAADEEGSAGQNRAASAPSDEDLRRLRGGVESKRLLQELSGVQLAGDWGTKLNTIVRGIMRLKQTDPSAKSLVFTQWAQMVDVISLALRMNRISHARMDSKDARLSASVHTVGRQNTNTVGRAVSRFISDPECLVLVLTTQKGSTGLTLVNATHVWFLEPIISPSVELQALSRVHRIGQTKPTFVHHCICVNTIEERVMELNSRKIALELHKIRPASDSAETSSSSGNDESLEQIAVVKSGTEEEQLYSADVRYLFFGDLDSR